MIPYKELLERSMPIPKVKWDKKWYNNMIDKNNKKVYAYTTADGKYTLSPSGEHPTKKLSHKDKRTFWMLWDNVNNRKWAGNTFLSLQKAKDFTAQEFYSI